MAICAASWQKAWRISLYPVFDGYNHIQFQIRDPEGFATMLRSIMEENHVPELPFLKEQG